jgi:DNA mismatch endonuclease (patch repair protein)
MTDIFTADKRSAIMRAVKTKNTAPEAAVRSILRQLHLRFSTNSRKLPGRPDLVVGDLGLAIFVHGCLWHGHKDCARGKLPTQNREFWKKKIVGNQLRDVRTAAALRRMGYSVVTIWACQTNRVEWLQHRILSIAARRKGRATRYE